MKASTPMPQVIYEISSKGLGMTCVVDDEDVLSGIITDGDLRRHMTGTSNLLNRTAGDVMTRNPITIRRDTSQPRRCWCSSAARSPQSSSSTTTNESRVSCTYITYGVRIVLAHE